MSTTFTKGQTVRGKVCGLFKVVKVEWSEVMGQHIVTVNEIGPQGQISRSKMRFTEDILVAVDG